MSWMDGARRVGGWLWVFGGLACQLVGGFAFAVWPGWITGTVLVAIGLLGIATLPRVAERLGRIPRVLGIVVAVLLAVSLLGAVADRFGLFGPAGSPGVSWGNWPAFVAYTAGLLPGLPAPAVTVAAIAATIAEAVLGVALIVGWQRRWVGKAAAGLFAVYLVAMLPSVGAGEVVRYGVPMLIGGALLVSATPRFDRREAPAYA
ncbi:putative membrane protein YphA (DoxX/SURF4 family) [Naumannella cuiyingiana]|uniref:Putative membrane protein YphA (DoxX/SURF4 family) n=1 Tax=Naumannella cuiyingiana TaxID=1347891 RepID=A0A7Z0IK38_9ACTN|nr:hypothetical protein [Naumannella cuiyingiana]NYI70057.1 putative membrane protein YphA (DoxX/SURF4 family) [Naumannella cuiyingiana]